jgi:2-polyprenyl-3-methyl-5-hydroxy-6-metoxy-1,4-benzoquinol methylase
MNSTTKKEENYWDKHFQQELLRMKKDKKVYSRYYWEHYHSSLAKAIREHSKNCKGLKILELGCGSGKASLTTGIEATYYLVDVSRNALKTAEYLSKILKIKRVKTFRREVFDTNFEFDYFDIVVSIGLIEHYSSEDILRIFSEIKKVIKKEGVIFIGIPNYKSLPYKKANLLKALDQKFKITKIIPGYRNHSEKPYTEMEMKELINKSKLKVVRIKNIGSWMPVETPEFILKIFSNLRGGNLFYKNKFLTLYIIEEDNK